MPQPDPTLALQLWNAGEPVDAIARASGYACDSGVRRAIKRLGGTPRAVGNHSKTAWTAEQDATLRQMAADRHSSATTALALGVTRNAAIGRARRLGVTFGGGPGGPKLAGTPQPKPSRPRKPAPAKPKLTMITNAHYVAPRRAPPFEPRPTPRHTPESRAICDYLASIDRKSQARG